MEKLIIDTDLGYDCDDGGVLVLANKLYKQKLIDILAITHCVNRTEGAMAIKRINEYYGNKNIPVGVSDDYAFDVDNLYDEFFKKFKYSEGFNGFSVKPSFYKLLHAAFSDEELQADTDFPNPEDLIKEKLQGVEDNSVILLCIGQLNDFAKLIKSSYELLNRKLKRAVVMCGNFLQAGKYYDDGELLWPGEFNIIIDIESAKFVFNNNDLPIDIIDYNQGIGVLTGSGFIGQEDNGVYKMYKSHGKGRECASWDPISFLYASGMYENLFNVSEYGKVLVEEGGRTVFNTKSGKHRLVSIKPEKKSEIRNIINNLFRDQSFTELHK